VVGGLDQRKSTDFSPSSRGAVQFVIKRGVCSMEQMWVPSPLCDECGCSIEERIHPRITYASVCQMLPLLLLPFKF